MDITCSYLTLCGSTHGQPPRYPMLDRAKAAAAAGIPSMGIRLDEHAVASSAALRYVRIPEAEWVDLGETVTPVHIWRIRYCAEYLGVTRINAGVCAKGITPLEAARNLASLLDVTVPLGITVAVEPVAFGSFTRISDIAGILETADATYPDCGLLYDFFQVAASKGGFFADISVAEIQVCGLGGERDRDPFQASQDRPLIADSVIGIPFLLQHIRQVTDAPVSYENPNARLRELPLLQMAEAAAADMALLG